MKKIRRSYKQKLRSLIENLFKLQAQSLAKGKVYPQDLVIAIERLKDFENVCNELREKGLRVIKGGKIVPLENCKAKGKSGNTN